MQPQDARRRTLRERAYGLLGRLPETTQTALSPLLGGPQGVGILDFLPGSGQALAADDYTTARMTGDQFGAGMSILGAMPVAGAAARGARVALDPALQREVAQAVIVPAGRNWVQNTPKTLLRQAEEAGRIGFPDSATKGLARQWLDDARARAIPRRAPVADPLAVPVENRQRRREWLLAETRRAAAAQRRIQEQYPSLSEWSADRRSRVFQFAGINPMLADREAELAILEAVTRKARQRGWQIRHTSTGRDGRASSRYVVLPDGREVRLSDHHLPQTAARETMYENGRRGRWNDEVVINDYRDRPIDDILRRIEMGED